MAKSVKISFDEYFQSVYGDRWPGLLLALQEKVTRIVSLRMTSLTKASLSSQEGSAANQVLGSGSLKVLDGKVEGCYQLDLASVIASLQLPELEADQKLLDLCSAPGGKSLVQVLRSQGRGHYFLNDISQARLIRLKAVMKEFSSVYDSDQIFFFKRDASRWGVYEPDTYDLVICDVPCSSEAHGKARTKGEGSWSQKTVKALTARQIGILCSGFDSLKSGGKLLYSTCSINPAENDEIIAKFCKKRKGLFEFEDLTCFSEDTEVTEFGHQLFPDQSGMGPIYYCVVSKK